MPIWLISLGFRPAASRATRSFTLIPGKYSTGYLVEPQNPPQIAKMITEIFANWDLAERKGKQARDRCLECYGTKAMSKILISVFETLRPRDD